ncbi:hypothetical protein [Streptomyces sp. NPDC048442]|uniref:hypothetical protein n=1 Tax=Streptomyces sp. NPDC048442 TaxID=3154823 RepID=UPI0034244374
MGERVAPLAGAGAVRFGGVDGFGAWLRGGAGGSARRSGGAAGFGVAAEGVGIAVGVRGGVSVGVADGVGVGGGVADSVDAVEAVDGDAGREGAALVVS